MTEERTDKQVCPKCGSLEEKTVRGVVKCSECGHPKREEPKQPSLSPSEVADRLLKEFLRSKGRREQ